MVSLIYDENFRTNEDRNTRYCNIQGCYFSNEKICCRFEAVYVKFEIVLEIFLFLKGLNFINKIGNMLLSAATLCSNLLYQEEQEEYWNILLMENPEEIVVLR